MTTELQELHDRLDAAEERTIRARYLGPDVMAEYASAGHAYSAALQQEDFTSAARVHRQHYDVCRPRIHALVEDELVESGVIRVSVYKGQRTWEYLPDARVCLRCGKGLNDQAGVYVFVDGKCAPDRTVRGGSGPQVLLCVEHGSNGANGLSRAVFDRLYRERYGFDPQPLRGTS